jgi:hypothetical protein
MVYRKEKENWGNGKRGYRRHHKNENGKMAEGGTGAVGCGAVLVHLSPLSLFFCLLFWE